MPLKRARSQRARPSARLLGLCATIVSLPRQRGTHAASVPVDVRAPRLSADLSGGFRANMRRSPPTHDFPYRDGRDSPPRHDFTGARCRHSFVIGVIASGGLKSLHSRRQGVTRVDQLSRRRFTKLAIGAAIVGFNPDERSWVTRANDTARPFDRLPRLDGALLLDEESRRAIAIDQGNLFHRVPAAVLRPGSV